jgi:hypothetical protein
MSANSDICIGSSPLIRMAADGSAANLSLAPCVVLISRAPRALASSSNVHAVMLVGCKVARASYVVRP